MRENVLLQESFHDKKIEKGPWFGVRYTQCLLVFFLGMLMYATRFSFSVAIVAMTENYSPNPNIPVYNWTNKSFILSTFFWGYVVLQIPTGILGTKFGTKHLILLAVFFNSASMLAIPTVAKYFGSFGVIICRIFQGLSQGVVIPSVHGILGKWALPTERCKMYSVISIGYNIGIIIGTSTTGALCASWGGWPLSFYIFPILGLLWAVIYFFFGASSPAEHNTISAAEKKYIEDSLKSQHIRNVSIPYKEIFTSVPVWACIIVYLSAGWGFSIFTTELPIYMDKVMKFNIKTNGVISSLPFIANLVSVMGVGIGSDYLINKQYLSIRNTRRLMTSIGNTGCAILIMVYAFLDNDSRYVAVTILVTAFVLRSINSGGYQINHVDLAPNFSSTLMGIINSSCEIFSLITPLAVQYIVTDESDQHQWRIIFLTAVVLYITSTIFYFFCASGDIQPWNNISEIFQDKAKEELLEENLLKINVA